MQKLFKKIKTKQKKGIKRQLVPFLFDYSKIFVIL